MQNERCISGNIVHLTDAAKNVDHAHMVNVLTTDIYKLEYILYLLSFPL
jgi:hypothetical protein